MCLLDVLFTVYEISTQCGCTLSFASESMHFVWWVVLRAVIYVHEYTRCKFAYMYVCVYICIHIIYIYVHMYMYMYTYIFTHEHVCMYIYTSMYIFIHVDVNKIYVCVHMR